MRRRRLRSSQSALEQIQFRIAVVGEPVHAMVFEEAPDDRTHADVLRHARHARPQRAGAAHDQVDLDARLRSDVQRADDLRLVERVHLGDDARGLAGACVARLAIDALQHARVQRERRLQQALELDRRRQARELAEDQVDIVADVRIGGDQAEVGVRARGAGVVVARAQVHVAAQLAAFAAHDEQHLGVRLVTDDAVDDLHAGVLQAIGEAEVGFLVEARAQLDDDGDVLAVARGLHQLFDDRRILARAIQRLLDREHVRVFGRLLDQLQHGREGIEGVVQQHVAFGHALEHRVHVAQRARLERRVFQVGALHQVVDLDDAVEVDRPVDAIDRVLGQVEVHQQRAHDFVRALLGDLQAHRAQVTAADEFVAQGEREVFDFFLVDDQLGVARDAELVRALHLHAREQLVDEAPTAPRTGTRSRSGRRRLPAESG